MIDSKRVRAYCKEDISLIENYEQAINDKTQTWHCHHRDEIRILPSGMKVIRSKEELIENGRYFDCPANELIFLTRKEHVRLHRLEGEICKGLKGRKASEETKQKMSMSRKGHKVSEDTRNNISLAKNGKVYSEFGIKYKEHFGYGRDVDEKQYARERTFWVRHNHKFRWELQ